MSLVATTRWVESAVNFTSVHSPTMRLFRFRLLDLAGAAMMKSVFWMFWMLELLGSWLTAYWCSDWCLLMGLIAHLSTWETTWESTWETFANNAFSSFSSFCGGRKNLWMSATIRGKHTQEPRDSVLICLSDYQTTAQHDCREQPHFLLSLRRALSPSFSLFLAQCLPIWRWLLSLQNNRTHSFSRFSRDFLAICHAIFSQFSRNLSRDLAICHGLADSSRFNVFVTFSNKFVWIEKIKFAIFLPRFSGNNPSERALS